MTTEYTQIATIAVPEPLIPDANQLALCLGESAQTIRHSAQHRTKTQAAICTQSAQR